MTFEANGIFDFQGDLRDFRTSINLIDTEEIKRDALKEIAAEMTDMVTQTLRSHPDINAPATTGPHESGPGPSIATKSAWIAEPVNGDTWIVRPHPEVQQRAIVLNDGYGRITPNDADALRFTINGVPIYAASVDGPDETRYFQAAFNRLVSSGRIQEIGRDALEREADRAFDEGGGVLGK